MSTTSRTWPRPVPVIGDRSSASERADKPDAWAFPDESRAALYDVIRARRDVRRFRPDPVPPETLARVLEAAHAAPSVGHSQPWRFLVVEDAPTRERAAWMADQQRLLQADQLDPDSARQLLDLQLEGIREAPLGIAVCCDRRTAAAGVLGRATFTDADLWSCACAIQNLWLAARAEGLGLGWVTLFDRQELADLLGLPAGVETLGWLCLGWPDERPPAPGLERAGWSRRRPVAEVTLTDAWSERPAPPSRLRAPEQRAVVSARDDADELLTPPGSLGVLDRALDRLVALGRSGTSSATLVLAAGAHAVTEHGVSAFDPAVGAHVLDAARAGSALGTVTATASGLRTAVVDAGAASGDLVRTDALAPEQATDLVQAGRALAAEHGRDGLLALGEVGIGNTTVAAALAAALLRRPAEDVVGLGAGADSEMLDRKRAVVTAALARTAGATDPLRLLAALGGPEIALLTGVVLGAADVGTGVVLDGLVTSVAALVAVEHEPAVAQHLVAGQRSRERAHALVLNRLGLEPLLDLRIRAGEGVGASLATAMLLAGLRVRRETARTSS